MEVAKPIIRKIDDTPESLKIFEEDLEEFIINLENLIEEEQK